MGSYRQYIGRRVIVQLPDITLDGRLAHEDHETLVLTETTAIMDNAPDRPVDGEVIVERAHVAWAQVV